MVHLKSKQIYALARVPRKLEEFGERKKSFFETNYFVAKQPKMSIFSVLAVTPQTTINVSQSFEDGARLEIKFCGQFGILATSGRFWTQMNDFGFWTQVADFVF